MASRKPRKDELVTQIMQSSRDLSTAGILFHQAVADHLGLHITDHKCLDLIARHNHVLAGDLAQWTGLTTGAITAIIDRLEKAGFVTRQPHPEDKRKVVLRADATRLNQICQLFEPMAKRMFELLMSYDREQLEMLLSYSSEAKAIFHSEESRLSLSDRK